MRVRGHDRPHSSAPSTSSSGSGDLGGFIAGRDEVIHYIKHLSRSLIFTASLPPACVGAIDAAMDIIENEPERRHRLWVNTRKMKAGFEALGFNTRTSESPIIPITVGDDMKAFQMCRMLFDEGVFTSPVVSKFYKPRIGSIFWPCSAAAC